MALLMKTTFISPLKAPFLSSSLQGLRIMSPVRTLSTTTPTPSVQSGRFRVSLKQDNPLTYEQAHKPHEIMMRKGWNSHNTSSLPSFGLYPSQTVVADAFIRKFLSGTWHNLFVSEIIIKRQSNLIRIAGIVQRSILPRKMYFLIGYSEELLAHWLQCPVKLELQSVDGKKDVTFKFV